MNIRKNMKREYKDDCIHLKACRRLCKMYDIKQRSCNENCSAYIGGNKERFLSHEYIDEVFRDYYDYEVYDMTIDNDFTGKTLNEIINDEYGD